MLNKWQPSNGKEYTLEEIVNSFPMFCIYMFKYMGLPHPTEGQMWIAEYLGDTSEPDKILLALRGLGKSLFSQLYTIWRLLRNNNEHILVVSASSKRAKNFTNFVLSLIRTVPLLKHMYPNSSQRRASDHFDINGSEPSDSPNLYAAGIGTALAGFRATIIISDDIETPQNSRTPDARATLMHYFNEAINLLISDGERQGEVIVLGTYQSTESIYLEMELGGYKVMIIPSEYPTKNNMNWSRFAPQVREAVLADESIVGSTVDSRFPPEVLARRKAKLGNSAFQLQYNLNPATTDDLKFPLKLRDLIVVDINETMPLKYIYSSSTKIRELRHNGFISDYLVGPEHESSERAQFSYVAMALDPSGRGADETGCVIGGLLNGRIFLLHVEGIEGGYGENPQQRIKDLVELYNVNTIINESNFGDGAYTRMLEGLFPGEEILETRATSQKEARIIDTLEPLMNQHRIIVSRKVIEADMDRPQKYSWTYQLTHITRQRESLKHDDVLDATEILCTHMLEYLDANDDVGLRMHQMTEDEKMFEKIKNIFEGNTRPRGVNFAAKY